MIVCTHIVDQHWHIELVELPEDGLEETVLEGTAEIRPDDLHLDLGVEAPQVLPHPLQLLQTPADDAEVEAQLGQLLAVAQSDSVGATGDDSPPPAVPLQQVVLEVEDRLDEPEEHLDDGDESHHEADGFKGVEHMIMK